LANLEEPQSRFLTGVRKRQRPIAIAGALLALAGASYLAWGVLRFDPRGDPRVNPGFDGPVASLAFIFQRGMIVVENAVPQTPSEDRMLHAMARNMNFSAGIIVTMMRIFLGTLAMLGGFIMMTVAVERGRLLRLIAKLQE
jgi:hypothetical protein